MSVNTKVKLATCSRRGMNFQLIYSVTRMECGEIILTQPINIANTCVVQIRFLLDINSNCKLISSVSFKKHENAKESSVRIKISHADFEAEHTVSDDWMQYMQMGLGKDTNKNDTRCNFKVVHHFIINIVVDIKLYNMTPRALWMNQRLYDDLSFTDFNLKAEDGSVAVHKNVLSTQSDVFLAMLNREWKETAEGSFSIKGCTKVTVQTLQHFKDYMYLQILPEDLLQLETLLLIASCYMIDNLKRECINKLIDLITPENFDNLVEFACLNNVPDLMKAVVTDIPHKTVKGIQEKSFMKNISKEDVSKG